MIYYRRTPFISFSVKVEGIVQKTTELATVEKWRKAGHLILMERGYSSFNMTKKGKPSVKLKAVSESIDKAIALWKKGFVIAPIGETFKQKEEKTKQKLTDTLERVASCIENTNSKMAAYFRAAKPYDLNGYMVVDFPTKGNKIKRIAERFKKEGKSYEIRNFYYGTSLWFLPTIIQHGLMPKQGMLGDGIHVQSDKVLDCTDNIVLAVRVVLGNCKEIKKKEKMQRPENEQYDSMHAIKGKFPGIWKDYLGRDEWILRRAEQVEISKIIIVTS